MALYQQILKFPSALILNLTTVFARRPQYVSFLLPQFLDSKRFHPLFSCCAPSFYVNLYIFFTYCVLVVVSRNYFISLIMGTLKYKNLKGDK